MSSAQHYSATPDLSNSATFSAQFPIPAQANLDSLAASINQAHADAQAYASKAVERAKEAGDHLLLAKAQVRHGEWLPWLKQHCPRIAERTARSYMRLAGNWAQLNLKSATVADLTINEALALLAAPDEPDEPITGDLLPVDGPAPVPKNAAIVSISTPLVSKTDPRQMGYIGASPVAERDSNDWHTPARYIEAARSVLGSIDLDPFSSAKANETVKAARYFTVEDDAITMKGAWTPLLDDYPRDKAFVNPPYSRGVIDAAIARFLVELPRLSAAIVLTNNATETQWFQRLMKRCNAACFADHRIAFESPDNKQESGNTRGQVFFFFGPVYARMKFAKVFKKIGQISEMTPDLAEEINEPPTTPITAIRDSILDFPNPVAVGSKSNLALLIKSNDLEIEQLLESLLAELPRGTGKTKDQIRKLFRGMRREIAAMKKHMEAAS